MAPIKHVDEEEKQKIAILAAAGKSQRAIGRAMERDNKTIASVLRKPDVQLMKQDAEQRLAGKFEQLAEAILDSVSEDDLLRATLQQKAISSATMLDKARLIKGQSTSNQSIMLRAVMESFGAPVGDD